jgi:molybdate transport system ATP-binding protein
MEQRIAPAQKKIPAMNLVLKNIKLSLADFDLELDVELRGRITVIFGASGAGKTSLIELVAGLRRAKNGFIRAGEKILLDTSRNINVPSRRRRVGYVPQDLALFPHLSVKQNLFYGYKPDATAGIAFEHVVEILEINSLLDRRTASLSGGEQQRTAFARALLASPQLLLLDEPLASLDSKLKARIIPYLIRIRDEFHIPMLYVTHELDEVRELCDEAIVLERGRCIRHGRVTEVFDAGNPSA